MHPFPSLLHLRIAHVQETIHQHHSAKICSAILFHERQHIRHSVRPSEQHHILKLQMLQKFLDVRSVTFQRVSFRGLL